MPPDADLAKEWLKKAHNDMAAARLLAAQPALRDTALYHCQQAAEKSVKGLLVFHGRSFAKIHDIVELIAANLQALPQLREWLPSAARLTPYAVRFRYPGDLIQPSAEETAEILACAEDMVSGTLRLLPEAIRREVGERTDE